MTGLVLTMGGLVGEFVGEFVPFVAFDLFCVAVVVLLLVRHFGCSVVEFLSLVVWWNARVSFWTLVFLLTNVTTAVFH